MSKVPNTGSTSLRSGSGGKRTIPTSQAAITSTGTTIAGGYCRPGSRSSTPPAPRSLGILKKIFEGRKEWWNLVPDQDIFASGGNTSGQILNLAARHKDGRWIVAYLGGKAEFSITLDKLASAGRPSAFWIDPRDGKREPIEKLSKTGVAAFSTPEG